MNDLVSLPAAFETILQLEQQNILTQSSNFFNLIEKFKSNNLSQAPKLQIKKKNFVEKEQKFWSNEGIKNFSRAKIKSGLLKSLENEGLNF